LSEEENELEEKEISELISVEKGWKNTFDALSDFLFILDKDFRFVRVNKAFCNAMKKEKAELIGTHCYKTLHGRDSPWQKRRKTKFSMSMVSVLRSLNAFTEYLSLSRKPRI
jgi:PAS domain-containing protein